MAQPQTGATLSVQGARQQVTLCQCGRYGHVWKPRRPDPPPSKCPSCFSPLWNKGRVYRIEGAEPPTRAPRPCGKPFSKGFDARRSDHSVDQPIAHSEDGSEGGAAGPGKPNPHAKRQTSRPHAPHEGEAHSTADKSRDGSTYAGRKRAEGKRDAMEPWNHRITKRGRRPGARCWDAACAVSLEPHTTSTWCGRTAATPSSWMLWNCGNKASGRRRKPQVLAKGSSMRRFRPG